MAIPNPRRQANIQTTIISVEYESIIIVTPPPYAGAKLIIENI